LFVDPGDAALRRGTISKAGAAAPARARRGQGQCPKYRSVRSRREICIGVCYCSGGRFVGQSSRTAPDLQVRLWRDVDVPRRRGRLPHEFPTRRSPGILYTDARCRSGVRFRLPGLDPGNRAPSSYSGTRRRRRSGATMRSAVRKYQELVKLRPDVLAVRANLGRRPGSPGRYEKPSRNTGAALALAPGHPGLRLNLALAYYKKADLPHATC